MSVDKCPKCGMLENSAMGKEIAFACGTWRRKDSATFHHTPACKRIAELQEKLKGCDHCNGSKASEYWRKQAQDKAELAVDRGNKLRECRLQIAELQAEVAKLRGDKCPTHG